VVSVVDRVKVGWRVPSGEWDAFMDYVHAEHGETSGYVGHEVERAMREWIDRDAFAPVEALADRLVRAAGRTPANLSQKKSAVDPPTGNDTTTVQCRVDSDVKERFAHHARTKTDDRTGTVLARALRERRDGGRARRVREKLERVSDDAEDLLAELNPDDGGLSIREQRTVAICNRLGEQFSRDDLENAIRDQGLESEPTIRDYTDRVLERRGCVPHPNNPDLFVPESTAREIARDNDVPGPDAPAYYRRSYGSLTRDEKVRGLRVELARRALSNNGRSQADAATIRQDIFDGQPSEGHTRDLMDLAADADGFTTTSRHGAERLRVDLRRTTDDLLATAKAVRDDDGTDAPASGRDRHDGQQDDVDGSESDASPGVQLDSPADVDTEMDALMNATPVTDGGVEGGIDK
jgi:hypothetical protein